MLTVCSEPPTLTVKAMSALWSSTRSLVSRPGREKKSESSIADLTAIASRSQNHALPLSGPRSKKKASYFALSESRLRRA